MLEPPTELELKLNARIGREGPLTFRDFMRAALYDPERGYYITQRRKIGIQGDYYTSSNVHFAFGAVVANVLARLLNQLSAGAERLSVLEIGAGTGQLAYDVLTALRDEHLSIYRNLTYVLIETSPAMRRLQREKLEQFSELVKWCELDELPAPIIGVVLSNELFDALPVHVVHNNRGMIEELYVTTEMNPSASTVRAVMGGLRPANPYGPRASYTAENRLTFAWGDASRPELADYLARSGIANEQGVLFELGLDGVDLLRRIAKALDAGYVITIDYGDLAHHLYGHDRRGTLRCFYKHRLSDSPLERIGEQDITASVNFSALIEYGCDAGLSTVSFQRQLSFLTENGLLERLASMNANLEVPLDVLKQRLAIKNLLVPGGISDNFRVLVQQKREQGI